MDRRNQRDRRPIRRVPKGAPMDARRVALYALSDVNRMQRFGGIALDDRLRKSELSVQDKRLATSIFYTALENRLRIQYVLSQFTREYPLPVIEDILQIAAAQLLFMDKLPDHAVVDEAVKLTRSLNQEKYVPFVNGTLRTLIRARDAEEIRYPDREKSPEEYLSVMHSLPLGLAKRLIGYFGLDEAEAMVAYKPDERDEIIRPNLMHYDDAAFEAFLTRRGWDYRKGVVPHAYHVTGAGNLAGAPGFGDGMYSIQGEGAMLAAYAVEPLPGETILDACAAPGGKAALLCELMHGTGRVHAWDVHEHRAELIRAVKKRLKLDNLRVAVRDASIPRDEFDQTFDRVLIDAPCSGLGVVINKPDIKYRVTEEDIVSLVETQKRILDACCRYVRPGGLLVYATCTILPEENEAQARAFLERHPEYAIDTRDEYVPDRLKPYFDGGMIHLRAQDGLTEGFFIARFRRAQ